MIRKHKRQLILSSIVVLLPVMIGLVLWEKLPAQIATHWGANGEANGWSGKLFTVLGLPLIILVFHWIGILLTVQDPKNKNQSSKVFSYLFILLVFLMTVAPMIYSYAFYRKQLSAGTVTKKNTKLTPIEKHASIIACMIGLFIIVFVAIFFINGNYEVKFNDTSFTVDATFWNDATVNYADIDSIAYHKMGDPGSRTFGYGTPAIIMGNCTNSNLGAYTGYYYTSCDSWVVLDINGNIFTINGKNEEETKMIYEELMHRIGGK